MKKWQKKLKKTKQYLKDQLFYAKRGIVASAKFLVITAALFVFTVSSVLVADRTHKKYLEHVIGSQVVFITSMPDSKHKGSATGFHVKTPNGNVVLLTNAHVCGLANDKGFLLIEDKKNSSRMVPRRVLEVYEDNDLCVVEPLTDYSGLSIGSDPEVGQPVWAIGYPLGESLNVSAGRVKDYGTSTLQSSIPLDKCQGPKLKKEKVQFWFWIVEICTVTLDSIQTDLVIYGGNSGSPMLDMWGNVVGVVFAANTSTNWGRSVPLKDVNALLKAY